jgi:hypothetical protein
MVADIVIETAQRTGRLTFEVIRDAYKTHEDPHLWSWANGVYQRAGIITRTVEDYCNNILKGEQLPLDFPEFQADDYDHLPKAIR